MFSCYFHVKNKITQKNNEMWNQKPILKKIDIEKL